METYSVATVFIKNPVSVRVAEIPNQPDSWVVGLGQDVACIYGTAGQLRAVALAILDEITAAVPEFDPFDRTRQERYVLDVDSGEATQSGLSASEAVHDEDTPMVGGDLAEIVNGGDR